MKTKKQKSLSLSTIIKMLQEIEKQHGDLPVLMADYEAVKDVIYYKQDNCVFITDIKN